MKTYCYLYQITNKLNGKIYVGVHKTSNLDDDYMGSGKLICLAIKKYGVENFQKVILEYFDTVEEMFLKEAEVVNESFALSEQTYNISIGGRGGSTSETNGFKGKHHSDLSKKQKSEKSKAHWNSLSDEGKARQRIAEKAGIKAFYENGGVGSFLNRHHSEETKQKMSESSKGKSSGELNSQYGKCWIHSIESKQSKSIQKSDLEPYLKEGWIKGRKMKF